MRRVRELRWTWIATLLLLALCGNAAAAVRASVDHDRVAVGEPVVLNIASDRDGEPDFAPLASDFELQGRSVSSQTSIVNGSAASQRTWTITLAPRRSGALRIPALDVGGERTDPIALTVTEQPAPSARNGAPVFIENTLETDNPYVQQTVVYTLRLYYAVTLLDGQLDAPSPPDAQLHQVGNDVQGSTTLGGRRYNLIERQYLLTPERSGTLQLPAPTFRGRAMGEGFDGMFDGGTIGARGQPKTLEVRPRPAQAAEPWLPAQAITLSVDPPSGALHAGEPFTLTVKLSGEGVTAAQLPDPQLSQIAGAQVYPEASTTQDSVRDGHLLAARTRRFAIVPNVAGVLLMPPIQQSWWDVRKDGAAVASVGVPTLEVLPGTVSTGSSSNGLMDAAPTIGDGASIATASSALRAWQFAAAIFALGWIATLAWGWRRRHLATQIEPDGPNRASDAGPGLLRRGPTLMRALALGELDAIAFALLDAAPGVRAQHLADVAQRLNDPAQRAAVQALDAARWGGGDAASALTQLRSAFAHPPRWRDHRTADHRDDVLPPLYPR